MPCGDHIFLIRNTHYQTTTHRQSYHSAQGKNYQITKSRAVTFLFLRNKKSAPFDKLKAAPIRLSSRQALAHKKKQSLLFIQKQKITKPPNHQTTKSRAVTFLFLRNKNQHISTSTHQHISTSKKAALTRQPFCKLNNTVIAV